MSTKTLDLWQAERLKAENIEGLLVQKFDMEINGKAYPAMRIWKPKAKNPYRRFYYPTEERREADLNEAIGYFKDHQKRIEERKAERKGDYESVKIGDVFCASWGYDQTNVDFYQVIEKHGKMATLKEIKAKGVPKTDGFMSQNVIARLKVS